MTKDVVEIIQRKIRELEGNSLYLKQISLNVNKDNIKNDTIVYWGIGRGIQICIELVIDISDEVLKFQVIKYGKLIYERELTQRVLFEARTMSEYMDMEHFRNTRNKYMDIRLISVPPSLD